MVLLEILTILKVRYNIFESNQRHEVRAVDLYSDFRTQIPTT